MSGQRGNPFMKKANQQSTDWFRFENAHKDEDGSTDALTKVYIYGEIGDSWWGDSTSANDFVKLLSGVKSKKIELHLNSPGGSIFDGIAIYNALKQHSAEIEVWVDALAASAASFIAQAGDTVKMTAAAMMMIHDGSTGAYGDAAFLRDTADILDKLSNTVAGIYAARAGEDKQFWRNLMVQEIWYDAQEAVDAGLADEVDGDTAKEDLETATNKWDLSIYNYAGRNAAPDPMEARRRIANLLKEAPVTGKIKNDSDTPVTGDPVVDPTDPVVDPTDPVVDPTDPVTEPIVPTEPVVTEPENKFVPVNVTGQPVIFMVNGVQTSDAAVVQARITMLEKFREETQAAARISFVDQLSADKKIAQPQAQGLKDYVKNLSDEGYVAWCATWDAAIALPILGSHGGNPNAPGSQTQAGADANNELETAREIVAQHKMGGMKEEVIKNTTSYKKLIELDPTYKL